jgi:hypothetical protein
VKVISANFNNDNWDDLAVANSGDNTVSIFLSNGDGTFRLQSLMFDPDSSPSAIAAVNLDGNNFLDLVVTTAGSNELTVFLNLLSVVDPFADPAFSGPVTTLSTGDTPVAVAIGDFNNDALSDVVVVNQVSNSITTYLFDPVTDELAQSETYTVGDSPQALAVGDFSGDGWDDVAVTNSNDDTVSILRNRGGPTAPAP